MYLFFRHARDVILEGREGSSNFELFSENWAFVVNGGGGVPCRKKGAHNVFETGTSCSGMPGTSSWRAERALMICEGMKSFLDEATWRKGLRDQGSGFRVQGSGFRVQGSGFRALMICEGMKSFLDEATWCRIFTVTLFVY